MTTRGPSALRNAWLVATLTSGCLLACSIVEHSETSSSADTATTLKMSPELLVDPGGGSAPITRSHLLVDSATDGANHAFVWSENGDGGSDVRFTRVDEEGQVRDVRPLVVARGGTAPAIAFDGANYFVAFAREGRIAGTRVTPAGKILDPKPVDLGPTDKGASIAMAWNGSQYLVTWSGPCDHDTCPSYGRRIYGARVTSTGGAVDTAPMALAIIRGAYSDVPLQVASHHGAWLTLWAPFGSHRIFALPVGGDGAHPTDAVQLATGEAPSLRTNGAGYLLAYINSGKIFATKLEDGGGIVGAPGTLVSNTGDPNDRATTGLGFDGTDYVVAWQAFTNTGRQATSAQRVAADATLVGEPFTLGESNGYQDESPRVSCSTGTCLVTVRAPSGAYAFRRLGRGGVADGVATLAFGPNEQTGLSLASSEKGWLSVWRDNRLDEGATGIARSRILGARLAPDGTIAGKVMRISADDEVAAEPLVASDGASYVVVYGVGAHYDCYAQLRMRRLSADGAFIDNGPVVVGQRMDGVLGGCVESPSVAFDGTNFVLTWNEIRSTRSGTVVARRITPAGVPLPPKSSARGGLGDVVRVVRGAEGALVFWYVCHAEGFVVCNSVDIVGSRIVDGEFKAPSGVVIQKGDNDESLPFSAIPVGHDVLVVSGRPLGGGLRAVRVSADGAPVGEPFAVGQAGFSAVIHDGRSLLEIGTPERSLVATQLYPSGAVNTAASVSLARTGSDEYMQRFVVATDRRGHTLVTYRHQQGGTGPQLSARLLESMAVTAPTVPESESNPPPTADAAPPPNEDTGTDGSTPPPADPDDDAGQRDRQPTKAPPRTGSPSASDEPSTADAGSPSLSTPSADSGCTVATTGRTGSTEAAWLPLLVAALTIALRRIRCA
jgi:hypothetical protein